MIKNIYCSHCNSPLVHDLETDNAICVFCAGIVNPQGSQIINWGKFSDEELLKTWGLVAEYAPKFLWELEVEMMKRESYRQLLETETDHSPTPKVSSAIPLFLRRILPIISKQARMSGGVVEFIAD